MKPPEPLAPPAFRSRRRFVASALALPVAVAVSEAACAPVRDVLISDFGAVADSVTINTRAIQAAINHVAARGGGTVVVPEGVFVTGALVFKPGVHLHLRARAVLRCSTDVATDFPARRTRIEGHFEEAFTPALINADGCDGFRMTGEGTLDGNGRTVWDRFWTLRKAASDPRNFPNLGLPRARLALIERSNNVRIEGVTFKDSQFWNLHLYRCDGIVVKRVRFQVPDDYKQAPSTDAIDVDSCRNIVIDGCHFSVTDDCIAAKGTKGPDALGDTDSPPVEHIRVRNCTFRRGHALFTCGSEATIVRDVIVENCTVTGGMNLLNLKLRPDTPQLYENITLRHIALDAGSGSVVSVQPWGQYIDLKGQAPPGSIVRRIRISGLKGRFGAFGTIRPNAGQTLISDISLKDIDLQLAQGKLSVTEVTGLRFKAVRINGKAISA